MVILSAVGGYSFNMYYSEIKRVYISVFHIQQFEHNIYTVVMVIINLCSLAALALYTLCVHHVKKNIYIYIYIYIYKIREEKLYLCGILVTN